MQSIFDNVSIDEGTRILRRIALHVGGIDCMHETWTWDDIRAESLIFCAADVATLSEDALRAFPAYAGLTASGGEVTLSRSDDRFVFVNFNFVADDE